MRHANALTFPVRITSLPSERRHRLAPLMARLRASALDRQLAQGMVPWRTPAHAARALQLTSEKSRRTLARSLEQMVEDAENPPRIALSAVVQPPRAHVRTARPLMLTLASRLRSNAPVDARGVASLKALLTDGSGALYADGDPTMLMRALQRTEDWLDADR